MNRLSDSTIKFYKDLLKVNDWNIFVYEQVALDSLGGCKALYNSDTAVIRLTDEMSFEEKVKTLIHEMLHIKDRDERGIVEETIEGTLHTMYTRFHERFIESQAQVIYGLTIDKVKQLDT